MKHSLFSDRQPLFFAGIPVIVNPICDNVPRMTLSPEARRIVTPEFSAEMDAWMLKRFGTKHEYYLIPGKIVNGPLGLLQLTAAKGVL